jgi:hypothetical protein
MNLRRTIPAAELKRLYLDDGLTIEEIAVRFDCSATTIRRRMADLGILARPRGPRFADKYYEWSPELAYVVGLIATDGNLSPNGRHLTMTSADIDLLETVRACLGINVSIATVTGGYSGNRYYRLQWGDRGFYKWLLATGLMPAKSLKLGPLAIPDGYMPDFVRGCIDGDGSIVTYTDRYNTFKSKKYVYERLFVSLVSGSYPFLEWIHATLARLLNLSGGIYERRKGRSTFWLLKYMKNDSIRLLKWLHYSPNVPCLARKRDKALPFLNKSDWP